MNDLDASPRRAALPGDRDFDIAIVGGGYSGLWAAYWLKRADPQARIVVLESEQVGFGASGRNGGWLCGKLVGLRRILAKEPQGRAGVLDLQRACFAAIPEILGLVTEHGEEVDAAGSGYFQVARTPAELSRLHRAIESDRDWGLTSTDSRFVSKEEISDEIRIPGTLGGMYSPHGASVNPAKLVSALARIVEAAGVVIYENTRVSGIEPHRVDTTMGTVKAEVIIQATEGYTAQFPKGWRQLLPFKSSMVMTAPLSQDAWDAIGWGGRAGVCGTSHRYFYSQRTVDGRIALGGRGLPYKYGSRTDRAGEVDRWTVAELRRIVADVFPAIADIDFDHAWSGVVGVPRDWSPSVSFNRDTGTGFLGGYVGQGLSASYVAGRTLADLVSGLDTNFTNLPWANRRWAKWEPEPLRFLGAYGMFGLYQAADLHEQLRKGESTSILARAADKVSGRY